MRSYTNGFLWQNLSKLLRLIPIGYSCGYVTLASR